MKSIRSDETRGVVLAGCRSSVVVVEEAFSLLDVPETEQNHCRHALSQLPHSTDVGSARPLLVVDPVQETSHVGPFVRPDYQRLLRVASRSKFHQRVVFRDGFQLNTFPERNHFPYILADNGFFFDVLVCDHVVPHPFLEDKSKGTNRLLLVVSVGFVFSLGHMIESEVETFLIIIVQRALDGMQFFSVLHILGQNGEQQSIFILLDLLRVQIESIAKLVFFSERLGPALFFQLRLLPHFSLCFYADSALHFLLGRRTKFLES